MTTDEALKTVVIADLKDRIRLLEEELERLKGYAMVLEGRCAHSAVDGDICCSCGLRVDRVDSRYVVSADQS